jgi:hypothetical protein
MINEDQTELINKYPKLFRQVGLPASESCMAWGIECGNGWYQIIDMLSEALINKYGEGIEYAQIKEKWGVLCVYVDFLDNSIDFMEARTLISEFEEMSSISCERCGKHASVRNIRGWYSTLCDEHFKEKSESI